jgi:hypothetical protein
MTLLLNLAPDDAARLSAAAQRRGIDAAEYVRELIHEHLPAAPSGHEVSPDAPATPRLGSEARAKEILERVKGARGKFAPHSGEVWSEVLHRERQTDKAREAAAEWDRSR